VQAISATASALGVYPWDLRSRWSAYLVMVSALAAVTLAADLVALARAAASRAPSTPRRTAAGRAAGVAAAMLVVAVAAAAGAHRQTLAGSRYADLSRQLGLLPPAALADGAVLVTFYEVPVLRYLYEHGPWRGRPEYPRAFRFEAGIEWAERRPLDAGREGFRFVMTGLPLDEAQARLPNTVLTTVGPSGSRLLAVTLPPARRAPPPVPGGG